MPAIPYLASGESATAELWNTLFAELDSRISKIQDNRSLLADGRTWDLLIGKLFFFGETTAPYWNAYFGEPPTLYRHEPFTDAALNVAHTGFNASKKNLHLPFIPASYYTDAGLPLDGAGEGLGLFFDNSLEAHQRPFDPGTGEDLFWLVEKYDDPPSSGFLANRRAQKPWRYAMAELVYEGSGFNTVWIPDNWNKYNFFRIHNLNDYEITFNFGRSDLIRFTATIPAMESLCIRRTSVEAGYLQGWRYFHRFVSGDHRTYNNEDGIARIGSRRSLKFSSLVNNVACPQIVHNYFAHFASLPDVIFNPHETWDAAALYQGVFPSVADGAIPTHSIIGDSLIHKGKLWDVRRSDPVVKTELEWPGFTAQPLDATALNTQLQFVEDGNEFLTIESNVIDGESHDLVSIGCNILPPVKDIESQQGIESLLPNTLDRLIEDYSASNPTAVSHIDGRTVVMEANYIAWSMVGGLPVSSGLASVSINVPALIQVPSDKIWTGKKARLHKNTVAEWMTLNFLGHSTRILSSQDSDYSTFQNRAVALTGFGLVLKFERRIPMTRIGYNYVQGDSNLFDSNIIHPKTAEFSGTSLVIKNAFWFKGFGFQPHGGEIPLDFLTNLVWNSGEMFLTPRHARAYGKAVLLETYIDVNGNTVYVWMHPDITGDLDAAGGSDYTLNAVKSYEQSTIKRIQCVYQWIPTMAIGSSDDGLLYSFWKNPDVLYGIENNLLTAGWYADNRTRLLANQNSGNEEISATPRPFISAEHFNNAAMRVNSLKKALPYNYLNDPKHSAFTPNSAGLYGTTIRPKDQYASFGLDSPHYIKCQQLGIPIKTSADFPASFATMMSAKLKNLALKSTFSGGLVRSAVGTNENWDVEWSFVSASGWSLSDSTTDFASAHRLRILFGADGDASVGLSDYYWCSIEDVKSAMEALGYLFVYQKAVVPLTLESFELSAVAAINPPTGTSQGRTITNDPFTALRTGQTILKEFTSVAVDYDNASPDLTADTSTHLFIESESIDECEFVSDFGWLRVLPSTYKPADVLVFNLAFNQVTISFGVLYPDLYPGVVIYEFHALNWPNYFSGNPRDIPDFKITAAAPLRIARKNPATTYLHHWNVAQVYEGASILFQSYVSGSLNQNSKAILTPVGYFDFETGAYSLESADKAAARSALGIRAVPPIAIQPGTEGVAVDLIGEEALITSPDPPDSRAYDVIFQPDAMVDL